MFIHAQVVPNERSISKGFHININNIVWKKKKRWSLLEEGEARRGVQNDQLNKKLVQIHEAF